MFPVLSYGAFSRAGKSKYFSGQLPLATGSEAPPESPLQGEIQGGVPQFKNRRRHTPCDTYKNFALFISLPGWGYSGAVFIKDCT